MGKSKRHQIPIESTSDLDNFSEPTAGTSNQHPIPIDGPSDIDNFSRPMAQNKFVRMYKGKPYKESASRVNRLPLPLQISAKSTDHLLRGFPYPDSLMTYGISKVDWNYIWQSIFQPLLPWLHTRDKRSYLGVPRVLEEILDSVAHWDKKYFRCKGLLMRLDMPGEEQFGLYTMQIYHDGLRKHFHHNIGGATEKVREKGFVCTRVVLDSISVLQDSQTAYDNGWTNWNAACKYAKKMKLESLAPPMNNEPWDFSRLTRRDRWPPSKHLYYDRFRGQEIRMSHDSGISYYFIPDRDSMDQRGGTYAEPQPVVACDECPFRMLRPGDQWPEAGQKRAKKNHNPFKR